MNVQKPENLIQQKSANPTAYSYKNNNIRGFYLIKCLYNHFVSLKSNVANKLNCGLSCVKYSFIL